VVRRPLRVQLDLGQRASGDPDVTAHY